MTAVRSDLIDDYDRPIYGSTDGAITVTDAELADLAWHRWRQGGIGGSDIAALLGLSNYASPVSLYYEKVGAFDGEREPDSQRQRIGKRMEALLAAEFHDMTGLHVVGEQQQCEHIDNDWARCTVDGFVVAGDLWPGNGPRLGTIQMKTDGRFGWPDGVPANIRAQCCWEMGVTGLRHCWLIVMFAGFKIEVFEIPWDQDAEDDWEFMLAKATGFWEQNVLAGVVPPMDDHPATTRALTEVYADPEGMVDVDDAGRILVTDLQVAKALTKAAQAEEDRAGNELRAYLGDKTDLIDGWTVPGPRSRQGPKPIVLASWREQSPRRFDLDLFRVEHPALAEQYLKESTTRVLRVTKPKENS